MDWTKEPPKNPGYYWLLRKGKSPVIVSVQNVFGEPEVCFFGTGDYCFTSDDVEEALWAGPIQPPAAPKD